MRHIGFDRLVLVGSLLLLCVGRAPASVAPGYTLHFQFIRSPQAARQSVDLAARAGAKVVSLVPPAHVWEDPEGLRSLDAALDETRRRGLKVIFSRLDAPATNGITWLFDKALVDLGRMPDGRKTIGLFRAVVGNHPFERWQSDETRYYARRYGRLPNLEAMAVGGMVEPFVSERGSLVQWDEKSGVYEIAQYTPAGLAEWHRWLGNSFHTIDAINLEYRSHFAGIGDVPMPRSSTDERFGRPQPAYFDLVRCINDWFLRQYRENRAIWHRGSRAPFLLQFSGGVSEKIARGRPEFAAFDLPSWIDEADALGMSLYTNAGYDDWAHAIDAGTLQLVAGARSLGKRTIVMESGCEAPTVTLQAHELTFVTRMGLWLDPDAYVYEYFRYARDGWVHPGMMVTPEGACHEPAYTTVAGKLRSLEGFAPAQGEPCFWYLSAPLTAREEGGRPAAQAELAGRVNRAVYQLASYLPCRLLPWRRCDRVPAGALVLLPPGIEEALAPAEARGLARCCRQRGMKVMSTPRTCAALAALAPGLAVRPAALDRLMAETYVENEADDLLALLRLAPEGRRSVDRLPVAPRPGVTWLQSGGDLYVWVEDAKPVVCRPDAMRAAGVARLWLSARKGPAVEALFPRGAKELRVRVPCRQWRQLKELLKFE